MFKLIANLTTKNGIVSTEQFFTEGERDWAVAAALKRETTPGFANDRLLETVFSRGKLITINADFTTKTNIKPVARFAWIKFAAPAPKPKPVKKPRKVAVATVNEFDLPTAPKKRLTKRQREFGPDALHRTTEAAEAATA